MVVVVEEEEEEEEEGLGETPDYTDGDHRHSSSHRPKHIRHIPISLLPASTSSVLSAVATNATIDGDLTVSSPMKVEELLKERKGGQMEASSPQSLTSEGSSIDELGLPEELAREKECGPEIPVTESNPPKEKEALSEWLKGEHLNCVESIMCSSRDYAVWWCACIHMQCCVRLTLLTPN